MLTFHKLAWIHQARRAVFRIETSMRGVVYMSAEGKRDRAIVEVDARRFLQAWRAHETQPESLAFGTPPTWRRSSKFRLAEDGFAGGISDPVPLAQVVCLSFDPERPSTWELDFDDGLTRTIWLLAQGAKVFTIECDLAQAHILSELAGAKGGGMVHADQLVPRYADHSEFLREAGRHDLLAHEGVARNEIHHQNRPVMNDDGRQPAQAVPEMPTMGELQRELRAVQLKIYEVRRLERRKHIAAAQWIITEFGIQPYELAFPPEYGPERRPSKKPSTTTPRPDGRGAVWGPGQRGFVTRTWRCTRSNSN